MIRKGNKAPDYITWEDSHNLTAKYWRLASVLSKLVGRLYFLGGKASKDKGGWMKAKIEELLELLGKKLKDLKMNTQEEGWIALDEYEFYWKQYEGLVTFMADKVQLIEEVDSDLFKEMHDTILPYMAYLRCLNPVYLKWRHGW